MVITVRCFGSLAAIGPGTQRMELPEGAGVADVLARLALPEGVEAMPMLDGGPAAPASPLRDGAVLDLLPIVEGG